MECYQDLYAGQPLEKLVRGLKGLQDLLGEYQDLAVKLAFYRESATALAHEASATNTAVFALGALSGIAASQQRQQRDRFSEALVRHVSRKMKRRYEHLFESP
jgi:CHAD domain-containing protein